MSANNGSAEIRDWLRSQGETPSRRGALSRRHLEMWWEAYPEQRPAGEVRLLPGPGMGDDEMDEYEDLGELFPDGPEGDGEPPEAGGVGESTPRPPEPPTADAPPRHGTKEWRRGTTARKPPAKPVRITAGIRSDIEGKISLALDVPGRIWAARDPLCGGVWVEQVPAMAAAWTRYVCQSPQLVEWFTSTGGGFILFLDILAATYPVAAVVMAHHVYHTIEGQQQEDATQPQDYGRYAA